MNPLSICLSILCNGYMGKESKKEWMYMYIYTHMDNRVTVCIDIYISIWAQTYPFFFRFFSYTAIEEY